MQKMGIASVKPKKKGITPSIVWGITLIADVSLV
jgi:hypothetical protein